MMASPSLTKSRYLAGLQCPKRLWLGCYSPELGTPSDGGTEAMLEMGIEIGRRAHQLFPGGVLVSEERPDWTAAIARTAELVRSPEVPAIFEAAFEHEGVRVRIDVLERLTDAAWGIREVKSGTSVKDVHLRDLAVQRFVATRRGLDLRSLEIVHVDGDYVRGEREIDWLRFFRRVELATEAAMLAAEVPAHVAHMRSLLGDTAAPVVEPSHHCSAPFGCEFWTHCTRTKPADWVFHLPGLHAGPFAALRALGIERIGDIPEDFPLTDIQRRVQRVLRDGHEELAAELCDALAACGPPLGYLDFETIAPAIPLYPGTRPYEHVPFEWSLHRLDAGGWLDHRIFLADGRSDPRPTFLASLLDAAGPGSDPVVVYSGYERRILAALAAAFPERAEEVAKLDARLVDLLRIVRGHVYHAGFGGSFSLKRVAPALVDGFGYDGLAVSGGNEAAAAFLRIATESAGANEEAGIRKALLAYCARDTEALVELHRALRARTSGEQG